MQALFRTLEQVGSSGERELKNGIFPVFMPGSEAPVNFQGLNLILMKLYCYAGFIISWYNHGIIIYFSCKPKV
jgi:hypothetical protein